MASDFRTTSLQILWLLTHKRDFLQDFVQRIEPEYFGDLPSRYLVRWSRNHFLETDEVISESAIEQLVEDNEEELKEHGITAKAIWRSFDYAIPVRRSERQYAERQTERFVDHQHLNLALRQAQQLLREDGPQVAWEAINRAKNGVQIAEDVRGVALMAGMPEAIKRIGDRESSVDHISTGIPKLDSLMDGGLLTGELACFIAPSGRGKTMFLCQIASMAFLMGVEVAYYTLEVERDEIWLRVMASSTGSKIDELKSYTKAGAEPESMKFQKENDSPFKKIAELQKRRKRIGATERDVQIRDIITRRANLDTIVSDLSRLRNEGHDPKLVVIDYADRLRPAGRYEKRYEGQEEVFQELQRLAKDEEIAIWTASQVGRSGLNTRELTMDHIQGAFSKTFECTYVIAAGQSIKMAKKASEEFLFLVAKARRGGASGVKFFVRYDLSFSRMRATERRVENDEDDSLKDDTAEAMSYQREEDDDGDEGNK